MSSFSELASVTATTKRSPGISALTGLERDFETYIRSLKCTPLDPVTPEIAQGVEGLSFRELLQASVEGGLVDINRIRDYVTMVVEESPLAYFIFGEDDATPLPDVADQIDTPAQDGDYVGDPTLEETGIGDGNTSVYFDGTGDLADVFSAPLAASFDGNLFTIVLWVKVTTVIWEDGTTDYWFTLSRDTNNYYSLRKESAANNIRFFSEAGGTSKLNVVGANVSTDFVQYAFTVSEAADEYKCYVDAVQKGATITGLGTFVNPITTMHVGSWHTAGGGGKGWFGHLMVFGKVLTQPELAALLVVGGDVVVTEVDLDILEGDILVVGSNEYPIRAVSEWTWPPDETDYVTLLLEDTK